MKLSTFAEVTRQATAIACTEDDREHYDEEVRKAVQKDGEIKKLQRDGGDFFIHSNEKETYVIINNCGTCTLYKIVNNAIRSKAQNSNEGDRGNNEEA